MRIDTGAVVKEVIVERGRATGVVLGDGTRIDAKAVIANVNPKFLFEQLVPRGAVPGFVTERMRRWKAGSGTFRMNVALSALPNFSALPGPGDHLTSGIILAPSLAYMDKAYRDVARAWLQPGSRSSKSSSPRRSTTAWRRPAPMWRACSASMSCRTCQTTKRDQVADLMIETVDTYAPGFRASVVGRQVLSPARS